MRSYDVVIRQGSNVINLYAGEVREDAQALAEQIMIGLDEYDEPWACTVEVKDENT